MKKFKITVDGSVYNVEVEEVSESESVRRPEPPVRQFHPTPAASPAKKTAKPQPAAGNGNLTAPMPGTIVKVLVNKGDQVEAGQPLIILEAMKMENKINASATGTVTSIAVSPGQTVDTGQLLLTIG